MNPEQFRKWRLSLGLTQTRAAGVLGISTGTASHYESGKSEVPKYIALACAAVSHKLAPYGDV